MLCAIALEDIGGCEEEVDDPNCDVERFVAVSLPADCPGNSEATE